MEIGIMKMIKRIEGYVDKLDNPLLMFLACFGYYTFLIGGVYAITSIPLGTFEMNEFVSVLPFFAFLAFIPTLGFAIIKRMRD